MGKNNSMNLYNENESLCDVNNALNYDDVFIIPKFSYISSRKEVNTAIKIGALEIKVPVMAANMADIVNPVTARAFFEAGGLSCLHRFSSIEDSVKDFVETKGCNPVFVSIGVNRDYQERFQELYKAGARYYIIDIAHGHSQQMYDTIHWIKNNYRGTYIMAGNIATPQAVEDLIKWGADALKVGIGPGANCLTKNITGVTMPQFTAVRQCAFKRFEIDFNNSMKSGIEKKTLVVADGGIKEIGDICKAIGAGADVVMAGKMFAGCNETPSARTGKYSGSASKEIQTLYRTDKEYVPTPEGITTPVEVKGISVKDVIEDIAGGLKSAYSYSNSMTTREFQRNCQFGTRHNK